MVRLGGYKMLGGGMRRACGVACGEGFVTYDWGGVG